MSRISYRFLAPGWSAKPLVSAHDRIVGTHTLGWTLKQARELGDPGEPPSGGKGELKEVIEDVVRDEVGDRTHRKGFRKLVRDRHKGQPRKVRWQRYLRRRNRRREARKRNTADQQSAVSEPPPPTRARPEQEGGPGAH